MKSKIIEKKHVNELLREISKDYNTYVPQRKMGGDIWMELLPAGRDNIDKALNNVVLEDEDILISSKDIFLPQVESLFNVENSAINETVESSPKCIFGIKSCDLRGILFADEFFKRNIEDSYYLSRIKDRFIVVIGCINPPRPESCFCTSAKTGPFAESGYDWQFVDQGDTYFVETGSKKGEELISKYAEFFKDASGKADKEIQEIKAKACKAVELQIDFQKAIDLMANDEFVPEENYERISERCIYCGACLYVCPTCTCFNVFDNMKDGKGNRCRNWDGCVFEGYTREASGHNPRKDKWLRTARRYEHKLKYDYKVTSQSGCVGCGRCLSSCPVDIGMSKFIKEITEDKKVM